MSAEARKQAYKEIKRPLFKDAQLKDETLGKIMTDRWWTGKPSFPRSILGGLLLQVAQLSTALGTDLENSDMLKDIRKRTLSNIKYSDRKPFKWKDLSVNLPPVLCFPFNLFFNNRDFRFCLHSFFYRVLLAREFVTRSKARRRYSSTCRTCGSVMSRASMAPTRRTRSGSS